MTNDHQQPWWKDAVIYQIYPASFKDSNGDGIGDVPGIIQSLDYIQSIGVDVIWISPMYASPQVDMGYDVSDYKSVYPPYGTVEDMERLIEDTHRRGMRIILDLVINHTSDQHAWFKESRSSKNNPKRDWYIWKPAKYDADGNRKPPTNWRSAFEGSAWDWDEGTQEYYLHIFAKEQPDLNWENPETRQAIYDDSMIYWLEKGVDGFRVDTVNLYSKDQSFPNAPITDPDNFLQNCNTTVCNGPRIWEFLSEMNEILSRYDAMTVGECPNTPDLETVIKYVGASQNRLNMIFQFDVIEVGMGKVFRQQAEPWEFRDLKRAVETTQSFLSKTDGWTTTFIESHDLARSVSRFGDDSPQWRERSAKLLAILFASLSGTLFVYQGQEIGMINMPKDWPMEEYKDIGALNFYNMIAERYQNDPRELRRAQESLQHLARDHARTPMQWTSAHTAGFTEDTVEPWMRVMTSAAEINVAEQSSREDSVLAFWRRILQLRKQLKDVLIHGHFELIDEENSKVFAFLKRGSSRSALVVCNMSSSENPLPDPASETRWKLVLRNADSAETNALEPWEARIYVTE